MHTSAKRFSEVLHINSILQLATFLHIKAKSGLVHEQRFVICRQPHIPIRMAHHHHSLMGHASQATPQLTWRHVLASCCTCTSVHQSPRPQLRTSLLPSSVTSMLRWECGEGYGHPVACMLLLPIVAPRLVLCSDTCAYSFSESCFDHHCCPGPLFAPSACFGMCPQLYIQPDHVRTFCQPPFLNRRFRGFQSAGMICPAQQLRL